MSAIRRILTRKLSSDQLDARAGATLFQIMSLTLLVLGIFKIESLQLNEVQFLCAMLLLFTATITLTGLGLLLAMWSKLRGSK